MADSKYQQLMNDMRGDATQSDAVAQGQQASLSDQAAQGMFNARDDIRHKLVEEGWYGQQTTSNVGLPETSSTGSTEIEGSGNVWGNGEGNAWNEGGSVWANENNQGVWGHENEPNNLGEGIDEPRIKNPEIDIADAEHEH